MSRADGPRPHSTPCSPIQRATRADDRGSVRPRSAVTVRRCCCCTGTRRPISCGMPPRSCWPAAHGGRRRPARLRRIVPAHAGAGPCAALQAGARTRPGPGDAGARPRELGGRRPRSRWADRLPDGAGPPRARSPPPRPSTSCPPARCGRGPTPSSRCGYWHWSFLAQPAPLPERLIGADPARSSTTTCGPAGHRPGRRRYPPEVITAYRELLDDPSTVEAICEDYRAGATIDREHDDADRGGAADRGARRCCCGARAAALPRLYGDVLDVWRPWAPDVTGRGLDATHFLVEDSPETIASRRCSPVHHTRRSSPCRPTRIPPRRPRRKAQAHRDPAPRILDPRAGDRAGADRDPVRRRVGLAHAPRRGGRLHRRRDRADDDQGPADAHPARRRSRS